MHFTFADKPKKREASKFFCFNYTYKDPKTGEYCHSKISTHEKDYGRAKAKREELKEQVLSGLYSQEVRLTDKQPISEFFESFIQAKRQEGKSEKTLYDYEWCIKTFTKFADCDLPLCNVTTELLRCYFYRFKSISVRDLTFRTLRAAFNFAVQEGKLERNPISFKLTNQKDGLEPIRDWFRLNDNEKDFVRFYERFPEKTYCERTAKNASLFAYSCAARSGEICHIKIVHINWTLRELTITNSEEFRTKNNCDRKLRITPRMEEALKDQLKNKASHPKEEVRESSYLFSNEAGRTFTTKKNKSSKLSRIVAKVRREVFPDRKGLHFHTFRHSYCQNAFNEGMVKEDIAKIAGHKSTRITERYAKLEDYTISSAMHKYNERQSVIGKPVRIDSPITGTLSEIGITECVQTELTT